MNKRVGIALGGGGARGLAHIGVIKALVESRISLSAISGSSMGAILGGAFAANQDIDSIIANTKESLSCRLFEQMKLESLKGQTPEEKRAKKGIFAKARGLVKRGFITYIIKTKESFFKAGLLEELIAFIVPDINIEDTKIPFSCAATDLANAKKMVFKKGSLRKAILASASIPGVFPPVEINGVFYCDGGGVAPTPVHELAGMGAHYKIGSNVKSVLPKWDKVGNAEAIRNRYEYITGILLNEQLLNSADIVISPQVRHLHWTNFDKLDMLIEKGYEAAIKAAPYIERAVSGKNLLQKALTFINKRF